MIEFTIHGEITSAARARTWFNPKAGKIMTTTPPKYRSWKERIYAVAMEHKPEKFLEGSLAMLCIFCFDMPKSRRRKDVNKEQILTIGNKDTDNLLKAIKDGCQKVIYGNDNQVAMVTAIKRYVKGEEYVQVFIGEPLEIIPLQLEHLTEIQRLLIWRRTQTLKE